MIDAGAAAIESGWMRASGGKERGAAAKVEAIWNGEGIQNGLNQSWSGSARCKRGHGTPQRVGLEQAEAFIREKEKGAIAANGASERAAEVVHAEG